MVCLAILKREIKNVRTAGVHPWKWPGNPCRRASTESTQICMSQAAEKSMQIGIIRFIFFVSHLLTTPENTIYISQLQLLPEECSYYQSLMVCL
jgi:hypothetical protein